MSQTEIIGKSVFDMASPEFAKKYHAMDTELMPQPGKQSYECVILKPSGEIREEVFHEAASLRSDGGVSGLIGAAVDITELKQVEQKLEASEKYFRSLFENMLEGYAYCKMIFEQGEPRDFVYVNVNHAFEALTGLKDVIGKNVSAVIPGVRESNHELFEIYGRVALTGQPERFETYVDALKIWFSISVYCPEQEYFVAVFDNITERKMAEEKIQRLANLYAALSQCNEAIVRCVNEEELFPKICRAVVQFGGMKMAWIGLLDEASQRVKPVASCGEGLAYLDDIEISVNGNDPAGRGPVGTAIREGNLFWIQDFLNDPLTAPWHERGVRFGWAAAASLPLHRNGVAIGAFILYADKANAFDEAARKLLNEMAMDISFALDNFAHEVERRRADELLRESEVRYKRITEGLTDYLYTVRVENNQAVDTLQGLGCVAVTGYMPEDFAADPYLWIRIVAPEDRDRVREHVQQILAGKVIPPVEYRIVRKDGEACWVSDTTILFTDATGNLQSYDGVIKDITKQKTAEEQIQCYVSQLESAFMSTVAVATTLSEMRDPYTAGHERRVAELAAAIGNELGLDARQVEGLRVAGQLHDIGKISLPAEILVKPGRISAAEYMLIKGHAQAGYDALKDVGFPWPVAEVAWQHHERMDGSGYPRGLKGEEILLEARIMSVADVVEAMASHRPYRPGHGIDKALAEIEHGIGSIYDTAVTKACLRLFREKGYALPC